MYQFINCFEVPAGSEDRFLGLFEQVNTYMRSKPGYRSHKLHRSLAPGAQFRFVNYVEWESPEQFQAAHDEGFRTMVGHPDWAPFRSTPALYEVVHQAG